MTLTGLFLNLMGLEVFKVGSDKQFNDKTPINGEGAECPYCGSVHGDMWESSPNDGDTEIIECS